jgi:hypothetical protein
MEGKGTMIWPSGDKYEGMFKEDVLDGRGMYIWKDG